MTAGGLVPGVGRSAVKVVHFGQAVFDPEVAAHERRRLVKQLAGGKGRVQNFWQIGQHGLPHRLHHRVVFRRQVFWHRDGDCGGTWLECGGAGLGQRLGNSIPRLFAQQRHQFVKRHPTRQFSAVGSQHQQGGADDRLGVFAGIFQLGGIHAQRVGQPDGGVYHLRHLAALGQLGLVVGQALQGPFGQQRNVVVGKAMPLVHAEVAVLRHGDQAFEHV